jgi:hypothetical protein
MSVQCLSMQIQRLQYPENSMRVFLFRYLVIIRPATLDIWIYHFYQKTAILYVTRQLISYLLRDANVTLPYSF